MRCWWFALLLFSVTVQSCSASGTIRPPAVAGQWYPDSEPELRTQLQGFFARVALPDSLSALHPRAILVPHAGYLYSGPTAAYAFALVHPGDYDTAIVIGPSHHFNNNTIALFNGQAFHTPLGDMPIDRELTRALQGQDTRILAENDIQAPEHSVEAEVPFLQYIDPKLKLVPIVTATDDPALLDRLAEILARTMKGKRCLIVISSDMSHYYAAATARQMDACAIADLRSGNREQLRQDFTAHRCQLCGEDGAWVLMNLAASQHWDRRVLLHYAHSGEATGDSTSVVGYCALALTSTTGDQSMHDTLLQLARKSIAYTLETGKQLSIEPPADPQLSEVRAVFVTLNERDELRGCIGHMVARDPLYLAVIEMAHAAAFEDPRFMPLRKTELDSITIEISILTPMQKIDDYKKIRLGIDGVYVRKGYHSGVYLPQVATETGWDLDTFLSSLCSSKAGLSAQAYKDPATEIYVYQVDEFSEKR